VINNPASYKIIVVICTVHTKNLDPAEIHRELSVVYSQNVMSTGTVRQWATNVHIEK
jgi:hypothetical protein